MNAEIKEASEEMRKLAIEVLRKHFVEGGGHANYIGNKVYETFSETLVKLMY